MYTQNTAQLRIN